jgi:transmembrane sensor
MTTQLLEKYLQHQCTPEEQTEVEYWLLQCKSGELDEVLVKIWNDQQGTLMPEELENRLIKQIPALGQKKKRVIQFKWWQAAAAAALVGIFLLVSHQWGTTKEISLPISATTTPQKNATADAVISNDGVNIKQVMLPDGSAVTLYPHASIRYPSAYNIKERNIILTGKAVFAVAKDKHRPFTVYARQLATTALGTQFLVDASFRRSIYHLS